MSDPLLEALRSEKQARVLQEKADRDQRMLALWDRGFDTYAIANDVKQPEFLVEGVLWRLRQERRRA